MRAGNQSHRLFPPIAKHYSKDQAYTTGRKSYNICQMAEQLGISDPQMGLSLFNIQIKFMNKISIPIQNKL